MAMCNPLHGIRSVMIYRILSILLMGCCFVLTGCATTGEENQDSAVGNNQVDPYENFNRKIYTFNDAVDNYVAEPITDAYKWITPQLVQTGVSNVFNNLKNINVVINDMLQAKFSQGAQDSGRLLMNTTVGLGGLFDVAKHVGWEQNDEDFEQTLAVWGVPQGSYLVIPFLGPTTARGIPGTVFDTAANPVTYVGLPVQLVSMLNTRANAEGALKFIDEAALDPYVFTRESFLQWRNNLATDGKADTSSDFSEFEDELGELDQGGTSSTGTDHKNVAPEERTGVDSTSPSAGADRASEHPLQPIAENEKDLSKEATSTDANTPSFEEARKSYEEASRRYKELNEAEKK